MSGREPLPSPITIHWNSRTKLIIGSILFVLVAFALYWVRIIFTPLIIGGILAFIFYPITRWVGKVTKLSHQASTGLLFLVLFALALPLVIVLIPTLVRQTASLTQDLLDSLSSFDTATVITVPILNVTIEYNDILNELIDSLSSLTTSIARNSISIVLNAVQTILVILFTFIIAFYLTRDGKNFILKMTSLVTAPYQDDVRLLLSELNTLWASFLRGQLILSSVVFVILTVVSLILGLPQPFLVGLWGGILEFMPSIGNIIWGSTAILLALAQGSSHFDVPHTTFALIVVITYIGFSQLDINILIPNIIGGQIRLHPMIVLIGVIIGLNVGGVLGVAIAAPTIATLRIVGRYIFAKLFDLDPFPHVNQASDNSLSGA